MTAVLTVGPLDMGADRVANYMRRVCTSYATTNGRHQIQVKYPATLDPTGDNPKGSIQTGATNLNTLIHTTPGPKTVLAYSQGAQVVGAWLRRYAHQPDAPNPNTLNFILIGNPERKHGKQPWTTKTTPNDTQYTIRDVARRNDNWADYHGKPANRFLAMFGPIHTNYWSVNLERQGDVIRAEGNTTYEIVP